MFPHRPVSRQHLPFHSSRVLLRKDRIWLIFRLLNVFRLWLQVRCLVQMFLNTVTYDHFALPHIRFGLRSLGYAFSCDPTRRATTRQVAHSRRRGHGRYFSYSEIKLVHHRSGKNDKSRVIKSGKQARAVNHGSFI